MRWAEDLDFLGRPQSARPWAWAVLLLGIVALGLAAQRYAQAMQVQDQAQWHLAQAQRRLEARTPVAPRRAATGQQAQTSQELAALHEADAVVSAMNHPWGAVLAAVEDACDPEAGQALLGVHHSANTAEVNIDAAVRDDAAALALVDALAAQDEVFAEARLLSRDTLHQPVGTLQMHVQIVAVLRPRVGVVATEAGRD